MIINKMQFARKCFEAGIAGVAPDRLIRNNVSLQKEMLVINGHAFDLSIFRRIFVVGAGKASGLMAFTLEEVLGDQVTGGVVVVKYGHAAPCRRIEILEAAHPYPDQAGVEATQKMMRLCEEARESDLVLCVWSGGGSALLTDVPEGGRLDDVMRLSKALVNSGAEIGEINAVRKHLSRVKGGQLSRLAYPAQVVSLILSDVVGDPLDVIASGPTVPDASTFEDALVVLRKYQLKEQMPARLLQILKQGAAGHIPETMKISDPALARTVNQIIGSNRIALEAAGQYAQTQVASVRIVTDRLEGNTEAAAAEIVRVACEAQTNADIPKPACLLFGGETTLQVTGGGVGGRNQHLALKAALLLRGRKGITVLAGGTDGTDGPTDMAGAVVDGNTCAEAERVGLDAEASLRSFDAYPFFKKVGGHVYTGPTLTNVMDMAIVVIEKQRCSAMVAEWRSARVKRSHLLCGSNVGPVGNRTCPVGNRTYWSPPLPSGLR
ncbi:MAG: glycerate kinase [Kiritimatiellia bacterium]